MLDDLNMLLPSGAGIAAAKKIAKKLPKKSKKDQKIPRIARQTKVDSTENISSKMKATARNATPPVDEGYKNKMKKGGKVGKYSCSHNRLY
jgi:hypothetical protein